jgi:aryl-alcohol dehydrogenase-like predicted oxidoreductase
VITRRQAIRIGALAGLGLTFGRRLFSAEAAPTTASLVTRPIPSTGERLPVVGLGTNRYGVSTPEERAPLKEVLKRMAELGGKVIDTAPAYGRSEEVLGDLLAELGGHDRFFLATKVTAPEGSAERGTAMLEESLRRLRTSRLDLVEVHNLDGVDAMMPILRAWKESGKIRYLGITTSDNDDHGRMTEFMRKHPLDFVQVDYSLGNRAAAQRVLPLAQERRIGVLVNLPLGGRRGNLIAKVGERPLPPWAPELGAKSWAQLFLKYVVSHLAVTCAIPGTTKVRHLEDNLAAARGPLPDEATRRRMEAYWDALD